MKAGCQIVWLNYLFKSGKMIASYKFMAHRVGQKSTPLPNY